jgi:hypothetical protein
VAAAVAAATEYGIRKSATRRRFVACFVGLRASFDGSGRSHLVSVGSIGIFVSIGSNNASACPFRCSAIWTAVKIRILYGPAE